MSESAHLTCEWGRLVIGTLVRCGVRDLVISPGSRSTPFVLAALAEKQLTCHLAIDERVGAFFALGIARACGRPAAFLCTSGTAGAHAYPAVIEAFLTQLPLVIVTADRPTELVDCGAAQTIDQTRLFGNFVRAFVELGNPEQLESALTGVSRSIARAISESRGPIPGPVHINARARKPLEPEVGRPFTDSERELSRRVDLKLATIRPVSEQTRSTELGAINAALSEICAAKRPVFAFGPAQGASAFRAGQELVNFVVHSEASSRLPASGLRGFDWLVESPGFMRWIERNPPDLFVQLGAAPTSANWERLVTKFGQTRRLAFSQGVFTDSIGGAEVLFTSDLRSILSAMMSVPSRDLVEERSRFCSSWQAASAAAWQAVDEVLCEGSWSEPAAVRTAVRATPRAAQLVVGNSLPIRLVDRYTHSAERPPQVLSQRGAAGIDGMISGAAGAAAAFGPTTAIIGDVTAFHDLSGLALAQKCAAPLAIVVINNGGGRIFDHLPIAKSTSVESLQYWTTPHQTNFRAAAEVWAIPYQRATSTPELSAAITATHREGGARLIEVIVPPESSFAVRAEVARRAEPKVLAALEKFR